MPDIRQLAGIVPHGFFNATSQVVEGQLKEDIETFQKNIQAGAGRLENDEDPFTRCSFTFHGQLRHLLHHQDLVNEYERELSNPSGIPVGNLMKPSFDGVLMSEECGILLEMEDVSGTP